MNTGRMWTNKADMYLNDHYATEEYEVMSKRLGRSKKAIISRAYVLFLNRRATEYVMYRGDENLASGTIREIAETLKIKEQSVQMRGTPSYLKRVNVEDGKSMYLVKT